MWCDSEQFEIYKHALHIIQWAIWNVHKHFALYHLSRPNLKDTLAAGSQITDEGIGDDEEEK